MSDEQDSDVNSAAGSNSDTDSCMDNTPDPRDIGKGERKVTFIHNPAIPDDYETSTYTNTIYHSSELSIMNLGHGRCGHLPDYSYIKYKYMPAWGKYEEIIKDNPADYYKAFSQLVYALKYIRGTVDKFETDHYDTESVSPHREEIERILRIKTIDNCPAWKAFAKKLSGEAIELYSISKYENDYLKAPKAQKDDTFLGKFFIAAMAQKSMVTNSIFKSGNLLAGFSIDYKKGPFRGIADYKKLLLLNKEETEE